MRKLTSCLLIVVIIISACVMPVSAITTAELKAKNRLLVQVVDKNDLPVVNARFTFQGFNGRWDYINNPVTNCFGELTLYDRIASEIIAGIKNPIYDENAKIIITFTIPKADGTAITEKVTLDLRKKKVGDTVKIKLKCENTAEEIYTAQNRTDLYVSNSKGGVVQNMLIYLRNEKDPIPQMQMDKYDTYVFTDAKGRASIVGLEVGTYRVYFSWDGGGLAQDPIKITTTTGVSEFGFSFDETLLEKKK